MRLFSRFPWVLVPGPCILACWSEQGSEGISTVGGTANVLACGMLEQRGYRIDLGRYMKISIPFSVAAVAATHILLQLIWL